VVTFLRPEYAAIAELRGELAARSSLLTAEIKIISAVNALIAQYKSVEGLRETVSLALPDGEEIAPIFAGLNAIAGLSKVSLTALDVHAVPAKQALSPGLLKPRGVLSAGGTVLGTYENLKSFLKYLESNIRVMDVENIVLTPAGHLGDNFYSAVLLINAYYQ